MQLLKSEYYELPQKYNRTVIRLLVQSPTRMFVYWEVSDDTIREFNNRYHNYSDCIAVLKITNLTHHYSYQVPVSPFANNYYLEVEDSGCEYQVELGRMAQNKFVNLYTSNVAIVPSSHPIYQSAISDEIIFANYLCISNIKKIKLYGLKEQYKYFNNQSHTAFENIRLPGSSENNGFLGSSNNSMLFS